MRLDEIFAAWAEDKVIDRTRKGDEALKIPQLMHKYMMIFMPEKHKLEQLLGEYATLKLDKREFYIQGPSVESNEKGWVFPPGLSKANRIMKSEVDTYLQGDKDLIALNMRIVEQNMKIDTLKAILDDIKWRNQLLRLALDEEKFLAGA